jgi:hypothetical protein
VKGQLFVSWLASRFGADTVDKFLLDYFNEFAFQSIWTEKFRAYLDANLLPKKPGAVTAAEIDEWIFAPGLPKSAVPPRSDAFDLVDLARKDWLSGKLAAKDLPAREWTTHEWVHFLQGLPPKVPVARLTELDEAFGLTTTGNAEIAFNWLRVAIRENYTPAWPRLEEYLTSIGRRRLIKPLYEDLMKTPAGAARARAIYEKARPNYHPIATATIDDIVLKGR